MEDDFTFYKSGGGQNNHPKTKISQAKGGGFKENLLKKNEKIS